MKWDISFFGAAARNEESLELDVTLINSTSTKKKWKQKKKNFGG